MRRTTIMADEGLLEQLREIARAEGVSLAEVIRQGLELRAGAGRRFGFVGALRNGPETAIADEADQLTPKARPWR